MATPALPLSAGTLALGAAFGLPAVLALCGLALWSARGAYPAVAALDRKTLKRGASRKTLETLKEGLDVVVIGSGASGLAAAVTLAKAGFRVAVFEQHDVAGGATHTFEEKGFTFDVGIHYTGGQLDEALSPMRKLWSFMSDGKLEWDAMDHAYDEAFNASTDERIPFTADHAKNRRRLCARFEHEGAGPALRKYSAACARARLAAVLLFACKALPRFVVRLLWPLLRLVYLPYTRTTAVVLEECGASPSLAGALTYLWGDYGTPPTRSPFFVQALLDDHYRGGGFFPRHGSAAVALSMVAAIERRGGHVFVRAPVTRIMVERSGDAFRAVGVEVKGVEIRSAHIISTAGFRNTFGCSDADAGAPQEVKAAHKRWAVPLVPAEAAEVNRRMLRSLSSGDAVGPSCSMVYLFVGLDCSDAELQLPARNVWHLKSFDCKDVEEFMAEEHVPRDLSSLPLAFVAMASAKDSKFAAEHPGRATACVLAPAPYAWFERWKDGKVKHRGEDYEGMKKKWEAAMLDLLFLHFPQVRGHVVHVEVGSPLSNDYYLGSVRGEAYGLEHTPARFNSLEAQLALHPTTSVKNLLCAGQDQLCVGVVSALMSGFICAANVSKYAALRAVGEMVLS